jgi:hypothetical protein
VAFVEARLDEDERVAEGAARTDDGRGGAWVAAGLRSTYDARVDDHIARHDPARVLRDVAAHRRLLAWYAEALEFEQRTMPAFQVPFVTREVLEKVLHTLAASWSNHPGFRPEWRSGG